AEAGPGRRLPSRNDRVRMGGSNRMGRIIRTALLLLGVLLVFTLFHRIGLTPVMSAVARLSWSLPLLLLVPACLIVTCDTLGWRFAFRRDGVPFGALLPARLGGAAIKVHKPAASLGGQPGQN